MIKSVIISPRLKTLLAKFNIETLISNDMSYIDIDSTPDYILYTPIKKIKKFKENGVDLWDKKHKNKIRVGRFFKGLLLSNDKTVEELVSLYRSEYNMMNGDFSEFFEVVSGLKIWWWYKEKRYLKKSGPYGGSLNSSCMRKASLVRLLLYVINPKVCKMLIMKEGGKIKGRALLWKTDKGMYMDRVYTVDHKDLKMYNKYAEHNNMMTYSGRGTGLGSTRMHSYRMKVKVIPFLYFPPYLDTFRHFNGRCLKNY